MGPEKEIAFEDIPFFPVAGVSGHKGRLLVCSLGGKTVLVLQGRFHYYEGYTMRGVTFPIRILARLGVKKLILTNAAGGLNRQFKQGDFMLVKDHINLMGSNPLIGVSESEHGTRFVDLKDAYDQDLFDIAKKTAAKMSLPVRTGVLAAVSGPSYETRAEARLLLKAGADAVTMSTVPETIVARQLGMKVLAISSITNSLWDERSTSHANVVEEGKGSSMFLARWLREVIGQI